MCFPGHGPNERSATRVLIDLESARSWSRDLWLMWKSTTNWSGIGNGPKRVTAVQLSVRLAAG